MGGGIQRLDGGKPAWLENVGRDLPEETRTHRLAELLPAGYEAYLRLFHPFLPWGIDPQEVALGDRRTWRSLADETGARFHGELQWDTLRPVLPVHGDARPYEVHDGELEPLTRRRLFKHLGSHTSPQPAFFLYDLAAVVMGHDPVLVQAPVDAVDDVVAWAEARAGAAVSTPEYVWPEDRSWVVCTDYDLTSTYVASRRPLADALLNDAELEVVEVERATRVDYRADRVQQPTPRNE